jgi:hypothetical protein
MMGWVIENKAWRIDAAAAQRKPVISPLLLLDA